MKHSRGFTLIEALIAATIFSGVLAASMGMAASGQTLQARSTHQMHASTRAHALLERMSVELRHASILAEDIDGDNDPDDLDTEDTNGNGQIDDDWSLADGETAETLSFNRALGGHLYSDRIAFRFDGQRVWRDGSTGPSIVLARDVTALTFTRQGKRITITIVVKSGVADDGSTGGRGGAQVSLRRDIMLRN